MAGTKYREQINEIDTQAEAFDNEINDSELKSVFGLDRKINKTTIQHKKKVPFKKKRSKPKLPNLVMPNGQLGVRHGLSP